MALKLIQSLPLLGQFRVRCVASVYPIKRHLTTSSHYPSCVACLCTSATHCIQRHGCRKLQQDYRANLSTVVREPSVFPSSSVGLHGDSVPRFRLTQLHQPPDADEQVFQQRLLACASSQQVFKLLCSVEILSDAMAAAALHHVADMEQEGAALRDPTVLDSDTIQALFFQLEQDSERLTESGLVSALLACTRLFLNPRKALMVRLVSESQARLDRGQMTVGQLCTLGRAMLAIKGPGSLILEQAIKQIQKQEPGQWSLTDLVAVYKLLQDCVGEDGKYRDLLNAMHTHAVTVTFQMDPSVVTQVLTALVTLNPFEAMPLETSFCKQAVQHVPHFSSEELTHILSALIYFGHSDYNFVDAMEKHMPTMAFTSHPETVSRVVQFFGNRNILSPTVFNAVAESFVYRADDYSTSQIARQIVAFGKLGYLPPNAGQFFRKVEDILNTRFSQFQPQTLISLLHACTLVQRFPVNFLSRVFRGQFLNHLQGQDEEIYQVAMAQLNQLNLTVHLECPFYEGASLHPEYLIHSSSLFGCSVATPVETNLLKSVKEELVNLLGSHSYFEVKVLTPYCYTIDVEIKLDEEGFVLLANETDVYKRIALCIDGHNRFTINVKQLLGKEAIKQRHLRLLGYEVVQIPYYEFEKLPKSCVTQYLHQKIITHR